MIVSIFAPLTQGAVALNMRGNTPEREDQIRQIVERISLLPVSQLDLAAVSKAIQTISGFPDQFLFALTQVLQTPGLYKADYMENANIRDMSVEAGFILYFNPALVYSPPSRPPPALPEPDIPKVAGRRMIHRS